MLLEDLRSGYQLLSPKREEIKAFMARSFEYQRRSGAPVFVQESSRFGRHKL